MMSCHVSRVSDTSMGKIFYNRPRRAHLDRLVKGRGKWPRCCQCKYSLDTRSVSPIIHWPPKSSRVSIILGDDLLRIVLVVVRLVNNYLASLSKTSSFPTLYFISRILFSKHDVKCHTIWAVDRCLIMW